MNIDAHFDVRPLLSENRAHSGSPFRQLLEDRKNYIFDLFTFFFKKKKQKPFFTARFDGHYFVEFASQVSVIVS